MLINSKSSHVTPKTPGGDHLDQIVILLSTGTTEALRIVGITIRSLRASVEIILEAS